MVRDPQRDPRRYRNSLNSYRMPHARGTTTLDFIAMLLQAADESNLFGRCSKQNPSAGGVRPFGHNSGLHHVRQASGAEVLWRQGKQGHL